MPTSKNAAADAAHQNPASAEAGHANDGRRTNAIKFGLFAVRDFVRPEEKPEYEELRSGLQAELAPVGILENTLADEIRRATWLLRRCGEVEERLVDRIESMDPNLPDAMETEDPAMEKIRKSVERARAQAHRLLHKSTAELRKLQTNRHYAKDMFFPGADTSDNGIADWTVVSKAHSERTKTELRQRKLDGLHSHIAIMNTANSQLKTAAAATPKAEAETAPSKGDESWSLSDAEMDAAVRRAVAKKIAEGQQAA